MANENVKETKSSSNNGYGLMAGQCVLSESFTYRFEVTTPNENDSIFSPSTPIICISVSADRQTDTLAPCTYLLTCCV